VGAEREFPIPHERHEGSVEDTPLVKLCYGILADAVERRATKIQFNPPQDGTPIVRYLIDDEWSEIMKPPSRWYPALLQVLKIRAGFSLARRSQVEEGRIQLAVKGATYALKVTVRTSPDGSEEATVELPPRRGPT
jgi:type II secretory ATPase GspE/PulE/Tfp pilus assembly ATPase PilB-like protein